MHHTTLLLSVAAIGTAAAFTGDEQRGTYAPLEQRLAPVYAEAAARLLGDPADQEFVLLPSSARSNLVQRPRRASGAARTATLATAREVATLLERRGYKGVKGVSAAVTRTGSLQLVLGELRFEPDERPAFARLTIDVIGSDGSSQLMEVLLKNEAGDWVAIKVEVEGSEG